MKSVLATVTLAVAMAASGAWAQPQENATFSGERLRFGVDRDAILDVEWAGVEANRLEYDAALLFAYALNPLVLNQREADGTTARLGALIAHRVTTSAVAAIALTDWIELGGELPFLIVQARDPIPGVNLGQLDGIGLGDMRLLGKFAVLEEHTAGVDVALIPTLTIPTAFPQQAYLGEGFLTFVPEVAVSRELGPLRVAANAGARFRPETDTLGLTVGHELTWRVGAGYRFGDPSGREGVPLELDASFNGATALLRPFKGSNRSPMEIMGGASYDIIADLVQVFAGAGIGIVAGFGTPDLRAFVGVRYAPRSHDRDGDGIRDDDDQCPDVPEDKDGFEDADGCPEADNDGDGILDGDDRCPNVAGTLEFQGCLAGDSDGDGIADADDKCPTEPEDDDEWLDEDGCPDPDNDDDGILDANDKCPYDPEDKDGYEDIDGCPDPDNDDDGILDGVDQCPNEPEDMDGDKDDDGCPDNAKIVITKKKVFALEKIYFDFARASIKQESLALIDEIATVLKENPEIGRVRIEGHTDNKGSEETNQRLSQARTESVRKALIKRGVPGERLEAVGFGEAKPIATNDTDEGREKNRRVEFVLVDARP